MENNDKEAAVAKWIVYWICMPHNIGSVTLDIVNSLSDFSLHATTIALK